MRELNRLGVTSVLDAGGGFQNYPQDYEVIERLARAGELTLRFAYNVFPQKAKAELEEFQIIAKIVKPGQGSDMYRHNGGGEMIVYSAGDFEDFREPRPEVPPVMEGELERVTRFLAENNWPFRIHATYERLFAGLREALARGRSTCPFFASSRPSTSVTRARTTRRGSSGCRATIAAPPAWRFNPWVRREILERKLLM